MSDEAPDVGDTLKRNGDNWIVEEVTKADDGTSVVTLRPQPKLPAPTTTQSFGRRRARRTTQR